MRLPQDAFPDTKVVTDVIYLRKRMEGEEPGDQSWVDTVKVDLVNQDGERQSYDVNRWIADNPDAVLGEQSGRGSMYGGNEYTVSARGVYDSTAKVADALTQPIPQHRAGSPLQRGPVFAGSTGQSTVRPVPWASISPTRAAS